MSAPLQSAAGIAPPARWVGVVALLVIATAFGANHVSARLAFDDGANVLAAVAVRSTATALVVLALLQWTRSSLRLPPGSGPAALATGVLVAVQSVCLYSAVARLPVALALLTFNTFPILLAVVSWLAGGERPTPRTMVAMPIALVGLAIALDVPATLAGGTLPSPAGIAFALGGACAFAVALHLTATRLAAVDGRLRTVVTMATVAALAFAVAPLAGGFAWPRSTPGWVGLALLTVLYGSAITALFTVLPRLGAVNNAAIMNFEPVAALVLAWAVLGQRLGPAQLAGGAIVIGAILLLSWRPRPRTG